MTGQIEKATVLCIHMSDDRPDRKDNSHKNSSLRVWICVYLRQIRQIHHLQILDLHNLIRQQGLKIGSVN